MEKFRAGLNFAQQDPSMWSNHLRDRGVVDANKVEVPIGSMYGISTYIWLIFMVHVGKYTIDGSYGAHIKSPYQ